jgi:dipeptidyl aminopeptidase/acylaminoacyl peptidase
MLEGVSNGRFKSMIAHCGLFNLTSWYGSTEELWFANWDVGGPYWQKPLLKSYAESNPINFVDKWNTPIMIIEGEKDYRVPFTQGMEAFQAAQLKGIKSRFTVFRKKITGYFSRRIVCYGTTSFSAGWTRRSNKL